MGRLGTGKRIGDACQQKGLSLRQLSIKADVPYSTLYSAVKRDSDGISLDALRKIAVALGVDLYSLADFDIASDALAEEINANNKEAHVLQLFQCLNSDGQNVAIERLEEMTQLPKYQQHIGEE